MYNYLELGQELINNGIIKKDNLFDYSFSPSRAFYEQFFQFCQKNLSEEWPEKNIQPAIFYYNNHNSFNAFALKCKNYNIIGINYIFPFSLLGDYNDFDNKLLDYFNIEQITRIFKEHNFTPTLLITQFSLLFIYYHELGHIFQNVPGYDLMNEVCENKAYDKECHLREFDADIFSAEKLAMHINEYWLKHSTIDKINDLEVLLSIGISGVFNFIVHTFSLNETFYTNNNTHPHPIIRVSYIMEFIIMVIEQIHLDRKINSIEVIQNAFEIAEFQVTSTELINRFSQMFQEYRAEIQKYTDELMEEEKRSKTLSMSDKIN